jgi:hypothetical protein
MTGELAVILGAVFMVMVLRDGPDIVPSPLIVYYGLAWLLCFVLNAKKPRPLKARLGSFEDSEGLSVFREACEYSTGRWVAPIGADKKYGLEAARHAE